MEQVAKELSRARESLLDLTLRNRLLNYRPSLVRSIRVVGESPSEVYEALVLKEKALEFRGTGPKKNVEGDATSLPVDDERSIQRHTVPWSSLGAEVKAHHIDRYLDAPYDDESLGKKLFHVYHEGRSVVEEQGYSVVHLALAFLEWYESDDSGQPRRAPLLLVPAELERVRAGDFSKLRWTGEDVFANISLSAKLVEHGVALPVFEAPEEKSGIDAWLHAVSAAIDRKSRWRVLSDMVLDFFSFTKFVMYKDLDPTTWPAEKKPHDHPLLETLFVPSEERDAAGFDENEIDRRLSARDLWHVMDADPSQIAVLEDVKAGRNLVVQGPPGTGKSQTITNVIGEALAAGKSVLFVSEKMAALEVVKSRLDGAGLGPFCLELHSRKANKKIVLEDLRRSLKSSAITFDDVRLLEEHEYLKTELNQFAGDLGSPVGSLGKTAYELFEMRQSALGHFTKSERSAPSTPRIPAPSAITQTSIVAAEGALQQLVFRLPGVRPVTAHPWRNSSRDAMKPNEEQDLRELLAACRSALDEVRSSTSHLADVTAVRIPQRLDDVAGSLRAAEVLARRGAATEIALLQSDQWNAPNRDAESLLSELEVFQRERKLLSNLFKEKALEGSSARDFDEFRPLAARFFRLLSSRYRQLRREFSALYAGAAPSTSQIVVDVKRLVANQRSRDAIRSSDRGAALFGSLWQGTDSNASQLRELAAWLVSFRQELVADALTERAVEIAASKVDVEQVRVRIGRVRQSVASFEGQLNGVVLWTRLEATREFGERINGVTFDRLEAALDAWSKQTSDLYRWSQFNAARAAVGATMAAPMEPLLIADGVEAGDVIPLFRMAVADAMLRLAFDERPALASFAGELHEQKIARFRELDRQLVRLNRGRLSRRLHANRPHIDGGASPRSEAGVLLGEFNRRRGHRPIRKLLADAGALIQKIKPCFLMSPLSVAQFLDPRSARFDLIVFDEASQVRPEDAVGSLLRGNQLVVMGDTRQLPPTSFFDHLADNDTDDDEDDGEVLKSAAMTDVESILHQCARSYPSKTLNWHYRSRHESLIAISNLHFYENRLRIYPSAIDQAEHIGLQFVHIPESSYDRGKSGTNLVEAKAVAQAAIEHMRHTPEKSLGVGTFNIKQQQAILVEMEHQLRLNPDLEPHFKSDRPEHFFVKNLETIQGDERDVILISVGFGRDGSGKLSMNFGPLNREGGERRLNVLISRAREKCVVFSNFTANDLPVDGATSKGVVALKDFLDYAQTRRLNVERTVGEDADSPFEEAVEAALVDLGHQVRRQVGCAGFRVDLAVIDPQYPGRYLLGVECDGAKYHMSPVARDRDRLRQQILENLGWRIHRIWSTDWYRNRAETLDRLKVAVEQALAAPRELALGARTTSEAHAGAAAAMRTSEEYEDGGAVDEGLPIVAFEDVSGAIEFRVSMPSGVMTGSPRNDPSEYEVCQSLRITASGELHLVPKEELAIAVEDVVRVEGPVHVDEVIRRIRTLWGLQRAGSRIRDAIDRAVQYCVIRGDIEEAGDFLRIKNVAVRVRRRSGDPPARIDLISDDEIVACVKDVLRSQFGTYRSDLVMAAGRRLGILATSEATARKMVEVILRLEAAGALHDAGDGMLRLKE